MNYFYHFYDESADENEKNIAGSEVSKQSIFLVSIDTFLQNSGIDSIEYLVSISAHPYLVLLNCKFRHTKMLFSDYQNSVKSSQSPGNGISETLNLKMSSCLRPSLSAPPIEKSFLLPCIMKLSCHR